LLFNLGGHAFAAASTPDDHGRTPWLIMLVSKEEDQHKGCAVGTGPGALGPADGVHLLHTMGGTFGSDFPLPPEVSGPDRSTPSLQ
jgi:hypothetical protein